MTAREPIFLTIEDGAAFTPEAWAALGKANGFPKRMRYALPPGPPVWSLMSFEAEPGSVRIDPDCTDAEYAEFVSELIAQMRAAGYAADLVCAWPRLPAEAHEEEQGQRGE